MFYLLYGILVFCFCIQIYRNLKCKDNNSLNKKLGIIMYSLLIIDFLIAIIY